MRRKEQNGLWNNTNAMTVFGVRKHGLHIFDALCKSTRRISITASNDLRFYNNVFS